MYMKNKLDIKSCSMYYLVLTPMKHNQCRFYDTKGMAYNNGQGYLYMNQQSDYSFRMNCSFRMNPMALGAKSQFLRLLHYYG